MSTNSFTFRGAAAELWHGYHKAADLTAWEFGENNTVTAKVTSYDAFRVTQQPLTFVVQRPTTKWVWAVSSLQITGTALSATVEP